jgi:hypothetical protein
MLIQKSKRPRRGVAPALAALVLFGILFSVGATYFLTTVNQERAYQQAQSQYLQSQQQTQQSSSNLLVYGTIISNSLLSFYVNNTGSAVSIAAYWVLNGTNAGILQYNNHTTLPSVLPYALGEGKSALFSTNITASNILQTFVIRVVTTSGVVAVGAYPNGYLSTASLNSQISAGLGSARITFTSFNWYDYISGPNATDVSSQENINGLGDYYKFCKGGVECPGGTWMFDINHPNPGPLVPEGQNHTSLPCQYGGSVCGTMVPIVFSVNVTNQDPQQSDIVLNSQTNLWLIETCDAGTPTSACGTSAPVYVFYIVNVNQQNGEIISNQSGSFTQINLPYGVTKTLFFAAAKPIQSASMQDMTLSSDDQIKPGVNMGYYGQFAIYLLLPGTKIPPTGVQIYGQNIPFESTIAGDNLGSYSENPITCTSDTDTPFQLQVNNSAFSGASIYQVTLNATTFSGVTATAPNGWSESVSNNLITWVNTNSQYLIAPGGSLSFSWAAISPTVQYATQAIFPFSIYWNNGALTKLQEAAACYINSGTSIPSPTKIPNGVILYVPITLTNFQTSAVTGGTPVMLNLNFTKYSSYLDNPVDNIGFFDYSGNYLNAWMENGTASSSTNSVIWVKLNSTGIPAISSRTIYMGIYSTGSSQLSASGPFGEAPQLTSTYSQFDDGAQVFSAYVNGNTPTSQFNKGSGITLTQATGVTYGSGKINALLVTGTGTHVTLVYNGASMSNVPMTAESNFESQAVPTSQGAVSLNDNSNPGSSQNAIGVDLGYSSTYFSNAYESGGSYTFDQNAQGTGTASWYYGSVTYSGAGATSWSGYISSELYVPSAGYSGTISNNPLSGASNVYLSILSSASSSYPDNMYYNWMRDRIIPPNGQMPTATYGPLIVG